MFKCMYCERESRTKNSQAQHLIRCKNNPNKIDLTYLSGGANFSEYNRRLKSGEIIKENKNQWSIPGYSLSEETRKRISISGTGKKWSDDKKAKHSLIMKKVVEMNPESYTSSNRGRTKQIIYDNIKFQGSWELEFYKWCERNNVKCDRYSGTGFKYEWNGTRTYYPDFYLPTHNAYVEVKGYQTDRDTAKWEQFPEKLVIIKKEDIKNIQQHNYNLPL